MVMTAAGLCLRSDFPPGDPWRHLPEPRRGRPGNGGDGEPPRYRKVLSRRLCWAFALSGTLLFKLSACLWRNRLISNRQSLHLMHLSIGLHMRAIRMLRRGRW